MALDITTLCYEVKVTDKHRRRRFTHAGMYDRIFPPYKDKSIKLLEIGVHTGGSCAVWELYFPNAKLFAVDILSRSELPLKLPLPRTQIDVVDQGDTAALRVYAEEHGPFDIIIDDGSHYCSHQIQSFETLWEHLNIGGTYVIEDTSTSIPGRWNDDRYIDTSPTCMEYFHTLVDTACMYQGKVSHQPRLHRHIQSITFKYDMIVVNKEALHK
jgi:hypothetical protein